jgi:hypothetical protein
MSKTATYSLIASTTLTNTTASVSLSSIPATFTDILLVANILATADNANTSVQVNGDTGTNYSMTFLAGSGSAATSGRQSGVSNVLWSVGPLGSPNSSSPAAHILHINDYANTTTYKTLLSRQGINGATYNGVATQVGLWRSTAAINQVTWNIQGSTFAVGATFKLYGIQAGNA